MIGQTIQEIRKRKGIKQKLVSEISGLSQPYLSQVEKGRKNATIEALEKIAQAIKVPLEILFFLSLKEADPLGGPLVDHLQKTTARLYGIPEEAVAK